ncbi:MAG: CinA family protein [Alphaproteobacteria bacterium]|nr:CinA family protein [Alphaproteobacteria bacterium]MBU1525662.1 CinA family protein [Alphaproteobacteria bacterium]MBU2116344.1 CinA family protein [Alphaproteobacteria bacterium]MBU2351957.1 CinA family protein [Alphaproteobacteria bacterium]MBU2383734.1 CinA family protein [Alphaproteobacteria bacterium]
MFDRDILDRAEAVLGAARARGLTLATAESCTGGLVAAALTGPPGASDVLDGGVVTYSNAAKTRMLGVPADLISRHGAVSEEVAEAMARGARERGGVDLAVSVTGVAGPGGGSAHKPVGLVWFGAVGPSGLVTRERRFGDLGRDGVRRAAMIQALDLLLDRATA